MNAFSKTVHPHGRGDNRSAFVAPEGYVGSPPRAWGQLMQYVIATVYVRFTPTGVGTIVMSVCCSGWSTVHPHGRGDNYPAQLGIRRHRGSPPRAWGQFVVQIALQRLHRFTPTGVGTIPASLRRGCASPVHPHGRGDNFFRDRPLPTIDGSPPRAWGQ